MRHVLIPAILLGLVPSAVLGQGAVDDNDRLSYIFATPTSTALEHVNDGLHVLDGEFLAVGRVSGDTLAEIIARVRERTWQRNPEVVGGDPAGTSVSFGSLRDYLRGDPRFRILALPAYCKGCEGDRRIVFLPYADTTGYLVGGGNSPPRN